MVEPRALVLGQFVVPGPAERTHEMGAWVREAAVDGPTVAQTEPPTERLVGAGEEQRTATPEGLVTAASRPKAEAAKSVVDTNFEASSSAVSRMSETTSPAAPELVLPPSLDHHDLVDQLAESFNEDQATVVLSRIRFPTPNRPRFDSGQTFWHQVVELLRNGVIAGDGVQSLIDVAAKMRPGHHFFACHATEQVPVAPDEPPPMPPSATPHPLDPASVSKVGECLGKHRKLVEHMSVCNADWAAAAESGNESLARTLLGTSDPVALVDGFRDAIVRLPRRAGSREVVDAELDLLDLLLPTVAGPVLAASREGKVKTTFALTVEACRAGIDGRPMEIRERHADDPTPRALVDTDPRRRPKTGAHVSFGVVDVAAQVEEQVDDLTSDEFVEARLLHSVMDVLRAADFGASKEVEGLPLAKKAAVAKSVIRKVRGRHGHTMTLYAIVPQRTTGAPPDPFVRRLADTLDGLCIIEPPTDLDDLDVELFTALRGLYTAYRKLLEDLSR